ncbi:DUF2993 domain-containing protein [filamentous cyanobacterium CCP5]|nr:DUF2993 domain-containing protein [filamentous cyanobacterium CCP5]
MLSGHTKPHSEMTKDFGERMLNSVASQSIRHMFTRCDWLDVSVRCIPSSKLLQGVIDSFRMEGQGLIIRRQFEAAEMMFETDAVSIDVPALLGGKIRLRQSTQAIAKVTLTEEAINKAFEADLVTQRLMDIDDEELTNLSGGEPLTFREVSLKLKPHAQVVVSAKTDLPNRENVPVQFSAHLTAEKRRRIVFDNAEFEPTGIPEDVQSLSMALTPGFISVLNHMVDLERFNLDGIILRVNRLETSGDRLIFSGYAQIEHFPKV